MIIKNFIDDLEKEIPMYPVLTDERVARIAKVAGEDLYKVSIASSVEYNNSGFKYMDEKLFNQQELEEFLKTASVR